jgi:hypothetical protein
MSAQDVLPAVAAHGARRLPSVDVDSYNVELKDDEGFLGDRASKGAFRDIIESWRSALRKVGADLTVKKKLGMSARARDLQAAG